MSRIVNYKDDRLCFVSGLDHVLGKFIQLYDNEIETPDGEGIVLDWTERFGISINLTGESISNNEHEVLMMISKYLSKHNKELIIITAEQQNNLN